MKDVFQNPIVLPEYSNKGSLTFEEFKKEVRRLTLRKRGLRFDGELGAFKEDVIQGWYDSGATPYMVVSEND